MVNLVSRCNGRTPDVLASTASESLVKTRHESQLPLSSWNELHQRTGRPVLDACSSSYSEWNADKNWSSQEWKSDELMEVRTGRLVHEQPPGLFTEHMDKFIVDDDDMDSDTVAESDMSLLSRSFLHSHGKELHRKFTFNQNTGKELTMKQMFDISEKLIVGQSAEILECLQSTGKIRQ